MTHRTVAYLAVLVIGMGIGAGGIASAASSGSDAAQLRRINQNLTDLNRNVQLVNKTIGGYTSISPTDSVIKSIEDKIEQTCRALAEKSYEC